MTATATRPRRRFQGYGAWLRERAALSDAYQDARKTGERNEIAIARRAMRDHDDIRPMEGRPRR